MLFSMTGAWLSMAVQKRQERGGGIALCINTGIKPEELPLKNSHEQVENLWVKIRDTGSKENFVFGVYYSLLTKDSLLMKPSCSSYKKHPARRPVPCWGTSAPQHLVK